MRHNIEAPPEKNSSAARGVAAAKVARAPRWVLLGILVAAVGALAGCAADSPADGAGQIVVRWRAEGGSCANAGISTVRITVVSGGVTVADASDIECDAGTYTIAVTAGVRVVNVTGAGQDGVAIAAAADQSVLVMTGATQTTPVMTLYAKQGSALVSWAFATDSADIVKSCYQRQVVTVQVEVLLAGDVLVKAAVPCSQGQIKLEGIPIGPHVVRLTALSAGAIGPYGAEHAVVIADKATTKIRLELAPIERTGRLSVLWTVGGLPPALACKNAAIETVDVFILSNWKVEIDDHKKVPCTQGRADFDAVGIGKRWVMAIASNASGAAIAIAPEYAGPVEVNTQAVNDTPVVLNLGPAYGVTPTAEEVSAPTKTGLTISWGFADSSAAVAANCLAKGIDTVRVELRGGKSNMPIVMAFKDVPFKNANANFTSVPPGVQSARVFAKGSAGNAVYEGATPFGGLWPSTAATQIPVILMKKSIYVTWSINGDPNAAACDLAGLSTVTVSFQGPGVKPEAAVQMVVPCEAGGASFPDGAEAGKWLVSVAGTNSDLDTYGTEPPIALTVNTADSTKAVQANLKRTSAWVTVKWTVAAVDAKVCTGSTVKIQLQPLSGGQISSVSPCSALGHKFVGLKPGSYALSGVAAENTSGVVVLKPEWLPDTFALSAGDEMNWTLKLIPPK